MDNDFEKWRSSLKPDQRRRGYVHFDVSLDLDLETTFGSVVKKIQNLNNHQFLPFIKYIEKYNRYRRGSDGKPVRKPKLRPIMYASHLDSHIYSFFAHQWSKEYERFLDKNNLEGNVLAYRMIERCDGSGKGQSNIHIAKEVFSAVKKMSSCAVITADISTFFDTLNHRILKERLCHVLDTDRLNGDEYKILKSLTQFRYVSRKHGEKRIDFLRRISNLKRGDQSVAEGVFMKLKREIITNESSIGIPQGSPASGLLANIYLSAFDQEFTVSHPSVTYKRYSDDIVVVCPISECSSVFNDLLSSLEKTQLSVAPSKVFITFFESDNFGNLRISKITDGLGNTLKTRRDYVDYLGFEFDGANIRLRKTTVQRINRKNSDRISKYYNRQTDNPRKSFAKVRKSNKPSNYLQQAHAITESGKLQRQILNISKKILNTKKELRKTQKSSA